MGPLIALTTDFGTGSVYVAEMKGVLLASLPDARIVDVTHEIPPQSIRHAEVVLRRAAGAFPLDTVHVVVVDPGVGTARRPIALQHRRLTFVGPDNGVLGAWLPGAEVVTLTRTDIMRSQPSPTFHGRDIFAPIAAELAAGIPLAAMGPRIVDAIPSTLPSPRQEPPWWVGETLVADRFGNLTTNLHASLLPPTWKAWVSGQAVPRVKTYGEAPTNVLVALVGSDGYLELAVNRGSAEAHFGAASGLRVVCGEGLSDD